MGLLLLVSIAFISLFIGLLWKEGSENEKEECLKVPYHLYMCVLNARMDCFVGERVGTVFVNSSLVSEGNGTESWYYRC